MRFLSKSEVRPWFEGKSVVIVGSGPSSLENAEGFIDSHDVVVRVNNYRLMRGTGTRTDVFYSFFGHSIKKTKYELKGDGVRLCMCKCPDAQFIESEWHRKNGKMVGIDFRWIYEKRESWWFCDTYRASLDDFLASFRLLGDHVPTTGFAAILDVLAFDPQSVYLTGFDFFRSGKHNINEPWKCRNNGDPICHVPERERQWIADNAKRFRLDRTLSRIMASRTSR